MHLTAQMRVLREIMVLHAGDAIGQIIRSSGFIEKLWKRKHCKPSGESKFSQFTIKLIWINEDL